MERTIYNDQIKSNQIVINSFPTFLITATLPTYPQCRRQMARISPLLCSPDKGRLPLTLPYTLAEYMAGIGRYTSCHRLHAKPATVKDFGS